LRGGAALEEAFATFSRPEIFDTDRGSQFTSADFTGALEKADVAISMGGRGRGMDNFHRAAVAVYEVRRRLLTAGFNGFRKPRALSQNRTQRCAAGIGIDRAPLPTVRHHVVVLRKSKLIELQGPDPPSVCLHDLR
jgi:hypothetical protein